MPRIGLSFSRKLLFALGSIVAFFAIVAAINISGNARLKDLNEETVSANNLINGIDSATISMVDLSGQVRGFLLTRDEDFAKGVAADKATLAELFARLDAAAATVEEKSHLKEIASASEGYMREAGEPEIRLGRDLGTRDQALGIMQAGANKRWMNLFKTAAKRFTEVERARVAVNDVENAKALSNTRNILIGGALVAVFIAALLGWLLNQQIAVPVVAMTNAMKRLASGDLSVPIVGADRTDEIGPMARAVLVFKENALRLQSTEAEALRQRQIADQERATNDAARVEIQRQQEAVVASIASGLDRLSKGDLTERLSQAFSVEYEKLRADFNTTAESLQDALGTISIATNGISTGSDQIAQASDDLSRRTEQQAASLEETAAALNVITDTVRAMAANATEAAKVVVTTRSSAEASGAIVQLAVEAMGKIKDSSNQISNIIGVIDEIAFQTNLLALNAGVEAARAGDAGRGFAVVASEVRGLAQRSAEAAKEIKALISASTLQVESGVVLVDKTGAALKDIIVKVADMDGLVRQISSASQEQATGLAEINTAVAQMDQVVQQNAAMVEESTAAAHALKSETRDLTAMVGRFEIGIEKQEMVRSRGNPVHAAQARLARGVESTRRGTEPRPMLKTTASAVHKVARPDTDWREF